LVKKQSNKLENLMAADPVTISGEWICHQQHQDPNSTTVSPPAEPQQVASVDG
jgi:hypothetical protein